MSNIILILCVVMSFFLCVPTHVLAANFVSGTRLETRLDDMQRNWSSITSSADGTKLAATVLGGYIYTSTDSGVTWTERTVSGQRSWSSISSSADGTKLAVVNHDGYIYTSTDSGVTWTERTGSGQRKWTSITSSADGTKLAVVVSNDGYIYTSTDSGVTWIESTDSNKRYWHSITSSADGTKLAAISGVYGHPSNVYISRDSGVTWVKEHKISPVVDGGSIILSADGTKLALTIRYEYVYTAVVSPVQPNPWNLGTTWQGNCSENCEEGIDYPGYADDVIIETNVVLTSDHSIRNIIISPQGVLSLENYTLSIVGDVINNGTLNAGMSNVQLIGTDQLLNGSIIFYNLAKENDSALLVNSGISVQNNLRLGTSDAPLSLSSLAIVPEFSSKWGSSGSGNGQFNNPHGIAVSDSFVYVADKKNHRIQKFTTSGAFVSKWGSLGTSEGQFNSPTGILVDPSNAYVYVSDNMNSRVQKFDTSGNFVSTWGWGVSDGSNEFQVCTSSCRQGLSGNGIGQFYRPNGIAIDAFGIVHVADFYNGTIQKFSSEGEFIARWDIYSGESIYPSGIALDNLGNVYAIAPWDYVLHKYDSNGNLIWAVGGNGVDPGKFSYSPHGVSIGPNGYLYVTDTGSTMMSPRDGNRIQIFDPSNGQYLGEFGVYGSDNGKFKQPYDIAFDSQGNLFITDSRNSRIQKFAFQSISTFNPQGTVSLSNLLVSNMNFGDGSITCLNCINGGNVSGLLFVSPPIISNISHSDISATSVVVSGEITSVGGVNTSTRGFVYGTTSSYGATTTTAGSFGAEVFTASLSNLTCGTVYHFTAFAINPAGTTFGDNSSFTTLACPSVSATRKIMNFVGIGSLFAPAQKPVSSESLAAQINELKAQLTSLQSQTVSSMSRNLSFGTQGNDVKILQVFLNSKGFTVAKGGPGSQGNETDYFGPGTRAALIKFQQAHGIPAVGVLGPITRAKLKSLMDN